MLTSFLFYGWALYYFIRKVSLKNIKETWKYLVIGVGLIIMGKLVDIFLNSLRIGDIDIEKVDLFIASPLIIFSIIKIAKILNKRNEKNE